MKIVVAYDGTIHAKNALKYGLRKIREKGGEVLLLHVFDGSVFIDYDAGPKAEAVARAEAAQQLEAATKIIHDEAADLSTRVVSVDGDAERAILQFADTEQADLVLVPPKYKAVIKVAPCPVYAVPGTILVPVDDTDIQTGNIGLIREEASATGSKVLLLGIVPVHLYSIEERKELDLVRKATEKRLDKIDKALRDLGLETTKIMRSGYLDEEILKAADEFTVSFIVLPSGGNAPSELRKATAVILDAREGKRNPVLLIPALETA